jgi:hypothetical protein
MVYDRNGNLTNDAAFAVGDKIAKLTDKLFKQLLADGMSIVEGRALADYLKSQVGISEIINLMKAQLTRGQK